MKPRIHCAFIKAWADGAEIEQLFDINLQGETQWVDDPTPDWDPDNIYRIKNARKKYRVAKFFDRVEVANNEYEVDEMREMGDFIEWITEWVEYD